ncbi:small subunit ribosomal protein S20 [Desulfobotulus alkaliphilus]|uniref:Small ribosomal subunit protein bS20 n=1 Tax=Desulfobotulus alkaliphilus TaxID=622671 RepID=A0A562S7Q6_9BACT|nr:30S ribosomal protein S20 [Desulfobotulus alkaliphilus]TWI77471.1 small subunit ribosomal protein S20 [Desulfobotulus alkaliphilus]
MANHKSAKKRAKQNIVRRMRNRGIKSQVKTAITRLRSIVEKDPEAAGKALQETTAVIDKAAKKGVLHRNTASRKVSRLAQLINRASA